jgi:hypothetical protein
MMPNLSDTKVLRYRCNAVTLSRSSDQALKILEALQARQAQTRKIPRPSVAAAPAPPAYTAPSATKGGVSEFPAMNIEAMKRDARIMMAAFSKNDMQAGATIPAMLDPAAAAAAHAAIATARRARQDKLNPAPIPSTIRARHA